MYGMRQIFLNVREFYNDINGATLTGAIDVIVVEQPDGTFSCSPFHVRFGKLGVLRSKEKVVEVEVNGQPLGIQMKLGESGEAFFVEEVEPDEESDIPEHLSTSPIPSSGADNLYNSRDCKRLFTVDDLELNASNTYEKRRHTADNQTINRAQLKRNFVDRHIRLGNIEGRSMEDVSFSLTPSRRSDEEDLSRSQNDVSEMIFKMDSLDEPLAENKDNVVENSAPRESSPGKIPDEVAHNENKTSRKKRRKTRKKNMTKKLTASSNVLPSPSCETLEKLSSTTDRSSLDSHSSGSDLKDAQTDATKDEKDGLESSQDDATNNRNRVDTDFHFFSDTELTGNAESRSVSPINLESVQSDSEIETKRQKDKSGEPSKSWEWGEFPSISQANSPTTENPSKDERKSMLSTVFSFMKSNHNSKKRFPDEGMYLSEITSGAVDQEVAEIYFGQKKDKSREDTDMDCESGNGPSLTQSPNSPEGSKSIDSDFEDHTKSMPSNIQQITLSLCGWESDLSEDRFNEHSISFTDFCNNVALLEDPRLVVKIENKYYSWKAALPMLVGLMCFGRPLVHSCQEQLVNAYMKVENTKTEPETKTTQPHKSSWWHWRGRLSRENTPAKESTSSTSKTEEAKSDGVALEMEDKLDGACALPSNEAVNENERCPMEEVEPPSDQAIEPVLETEKFADKCRKTLRLNSKQLASLNLRDGVNEVHFSVTTAYQGTTRCQCNLYKWKWNDKIVISDIDGTITKSDVLGHIMPIMGKQWEHVGVAHLFNKIQDNGYKLLYLSARAIGQARTTRDYIRSIRQEDMTMPDGPILLNPTSLITAFHREVIEKKPELFKISCLNDIKALFPCDSEPFYAGYGNRLNDVWAYRAVGIPIHRIFTINPKGELKHELTQTFQSSYTNMSVIVDQMFPSRLEAANDYSQFSYWREPMPDLFELDTIILN